MYVSQLYGCVLSNWLCVCVWFPQIYLVWLFVNYLITIIIIYIYQVLINALSTHNHIIHINLNIIFYTHVEHSPTKAIYMKYYKKMFFTTNTHTHTHLFGCVIFQLYVLLPHWLCVCVCVVIQLFAHFAIQLFSLVL